MINSLLVLDKDGITEYDLDKYKQKGAVLGRSKDSDIILESPFVSNLHIQIIFDREQLFLIDCGSKNGTFYEKNGQVNQLPKEQPFGVNQNNTLFWIGNTRTENSTVMLIFCEKSDGRWKELCVQEQITIGRDKSQTIVVQHPMVSRKHAVITKEGNQYFVYDKASKNGVFVNEKCIHERCELKENDLVYIVGMLIIFHNGNLYYRKATGGMEISMCHVTKTVKDNSKKAKKKILLDDVSCNINGGEFVAIVGGSGAGKTTLLNAMSGFDTQNSGDIFIAGMRLKQQFNILKSIIGFVPQSDIIYDNLTLQAMLFYTAKMKMPDDTSKQEIEKRIDEVLEMVELSEHKETFIKKLSGGQKKRASIAVELLADPKLFFLDEPTSGLDPGTEKKLMETLKKLSVTQGKTIIMVTHTTQSLELCDKVLFMGVGGKLCYAGNPVEAADHFQVQSLIDVYNLVSVPKEAEKWSELYRSDSEKKRFDRKDEAVTKKLRFSVFRQLNVLTVRYVHLILNDRQRLLLILLQPLIIGILLAVVAGDEVFEIYEDTKSILFALVCAGIWLGLFNTIQEVCKERIILKREYMANLKLGCYVLSKYAVQIVISFVQTAIIISLFWWLVGAPKEGVVIKSAILELAITLFLTIISSAALGLVISSFSKNADRAMAVSPFILILQLLFSGILFKLEGASEYISKLTISRFAIEAMGSTARLNEMTQRIQEKIPTYEHQIEEIFESTNTHILSMWGILIGFILILFVFNCILLKTLKNDRR